MLGCPILLHGNNRDSNRGCQALNISTVLILDRFFSNSPRIYTDIFRRPEPDTFRNDDSPEETIAEVDSRRDLRFYLWGAGGVTRRLRKIDLIFAREPLTEEYLHAPGLNRNVRRVCAPAFLLPADGSAISAAVKIEAAAGRLDFRGPPLADESSHRFSLWYTRPFFARRNPRDADAERFEKFGRNKEKASFMIEGIPSETARGSALREAIESAKPEDQCVGHDPFAHYLITPHTICIGESRRPRRRVKFLDGHLFEGGIAGFILVRTRWIDALLRRSLDEGIERFANLGAGGDSRPGHLLADHPKIAAFELNFPAAQEHKRAQLAKIPNDPAERIRFAPIDFTSESYFDRLRANGYAPSKKIFFLWEGGAYYLDEPDVIRTLEAIRDFSASQSRVLSDNINTPSICRRVPSWHDREEPLRWALPTGEMEPFLERLRFTPIGNRTSRDNAREYFIGKAKKIPAMRFDSLAAVPP